ncbi:MAG TPA: DNA polymerase III subunit delta [Mycobacteriales bacterium]
MTNGGGSVADLPAVTVVVGSEELLLAREVRAVRDLVRAADPDAEVIDVDGADFSDSHVLDLSSPDMFGGARLLVIRGVHKLSDAHREVLAAFAADPLDRTYVVAVHDGGNTARSLPDALAAAGARVVKVQPITRPADRLEFVQAEIRRAGGQCTAGAVRALVAAVGSDLRELSSAASQLVSDVPGLLDEDAVARFHRGRAETTGFAVADAAIAGQVAESIALLRSALETGTAPVLLTSALASGLRDVARVRGAGNRPPAQLARDLGMPPWKVDKTLRVARGWSDDGLADGIRAVATADAGVKGAADDAAFAVQQAVLAVLGARGALRPEVARANAPARSGHR